MSNNVSVHHLIKTLGNLNTVDQLNFTAGKGEISAFGIQIFFVAKEHIFAYAYRAKRAGRGKANENA
ncbi:MAG: hypothetical protein ACHQET_13105 [Chitinophagales bacterium]